MAAIGVSCQECGGLGLVRGNNGSRPCSCQIEVQARARIKRAGIPPGYSSATLASFQVAPHTAAAFTLAQRFVDEFIPGTFIPGLVFSGTTGTGKTHLAVAILRQLIEAKGIDGRFVDVREMLDRLRSSYNDDARESQEQILRPLMAADLVVIDDLGATRPTDWAFEVQELIIGGLYNRRVPTIVTTNFANLAAGAGQSSYERAARPETLGDRIGLRMYSRLQEMCVGVEMQGPDWRLKK